MPLLTYSSSNFPFTPFTKIYSADVNACFTDIRTLLNTTKLNYLNVQARGLTRSGSSSNLTAGTANYAVYNDSNGDLTEAATLPTAQGGLGFAPTISSATANQVLVVNAAGTGFALANTPPSGLNLFNYYNFF